MKLASLILAQILFFFPASSEEVKTDTQPKMTFVEGMCAGVVLGLVSGITIVVAIRCWQKPPPIVQSTNAPAWTVLPPAGTNAPPPGTNATATIDAGDAVEHVDLTPLGIGFSEGIRFIVEASDDAITFKPFYEIRIWQTIDGSFAAAAAYTPEERFIGMLPIAIPDSPRKFFRIKKP
jgi:hypothetical protein